MGFFKRIATGLRNFMVGRYGNDKLNMTLLGIGVGACLLGMLLPFRLVKLVCLVLSYGLMIWAIFRCFSRNTYKRYQENRKFLLFFDNLRDREHRCYICPKCNQTVRVPRGKGKIAITCPKCKEKFVKKT